jgi:hypothetical protein
MTNKKTRKGNSADLFDYQFELLKLELELGYSAILQHADITKGIKNWAIVTWSGSIGLALSSPNFYKFLWLTGLIPLLFWVVDISFNRVMMTFVNRVRRISDFINSDSFSRSVKERRLVRFNIMTLRAQPQGPITRKFILMLKQLTVILFPTVSILYIGLTTISLLLWIILPSFNNYF